MDKNREGRTLLIMKDQDIDTYTFKNVISDFPEIVIKLEKMGENARYDMGDNLTNVKGIGSREVGFSNN